jgi:hypothetical protein
MKEMDIAPTKLEKQISLFVTLQVVLLGAKNVLVQGVPFLYDINERLNIIILSFVSLSYAIVLIKSLSRKSCKEAFVFNAFIILSIVITLWFFPQNIKPIQAIALRWIVVCFITGYLVSKLRTFELLEKYMLTGSYVLTFSCLIYAYVISLIGHTATSDWSSYSMTMSNVALLSVIWQLHAFFKKKNKIALLAAILGFMVIFMYGSRNPLLAIICYIVIELYDDVKQSKSSLKKSFAIIIIIIAGLFAIQGKQLITAGAKSLIAMGINNRTISLIVNADTEDFSTGRDDIHKDINALIWDNPFTGNGICGAEAKIEEMAHSFYLDIFVTYGIIIGSFFLIAIILLCIQALKKSKGINHQILIMYICLVFPRGFTGGDMWQSDVFWWLMGIVFMILTTTKFKRKWQVLQS